MRFRDTVGFIYRFATYRGLTRRVIDLATRYAEPLMTRHLMPVEKWQTYLNVMQAFMNGRDTRDALSAIQVPTTLMMGRQSRYFSLESQHELVDHIPHAKVVIFDKAGHVPMVDQPFKFQREFGRFLHSSD